MTKEIVVYEGQNLVDIAIQEYGSLEGVWQLLMDNPFMRSIDYILQAGDKLKIDTTKIIRKDITDYLAKRKININTGEDFLFFAEFNDDFNEDYFI
jgi:hypothetical protein